MPLTDRLEIRPPIESDRARFLELFADEAFMVYTAGVNDQAQAHARFDRLLATAAEIPFAKQPIVERSTGIVLGYTGVARYEIEGKPCLEYGYRLCSEARGKGYATEAGLALLDLARETYSGTIYGMVDPDNEPSMNVITKLGFVFWKQAMVDGYLDNLYRLELP